MDYLRTSPIIERFASLNGKDDRTEDEENELRTLEREYKELNDIRMDDHMTLGNIEAFLLDNNRINSFIYETEASHAIVTAPTQVGKSSKIEDIINLCMSNNTPVIVSSDNKLDQQLQLYSRVLTERHIEREPKLIMYSNSFVKDMDRCLVEKLAPVVFCLDNHSQLTKISKEIIGIRENVESRTVCFIHDEGDVVTKSDSGYGQTGSQSHRAWNLIVSRFRMLGFNVKRIFVTATPSNCMSHYNITEMPVIFKIRAPSQYRGYDTIRHIDIDAHDYNIRDYVIDNNLNKSYGALLYVTERKTVDQLRVLIDINRLCKSLNCFVHTYNSKGIVVINPNITFINAMKGRITAFRGIVYKCVNTSISELYKIVKESGYTSIITIGYDMISRGISFVGEDRDKPFAANCMYYTPSRSLHNVALNQTIGRITGLARPELPRSLICTSEVYNEYYNYSRNLQFSVDNNVLYFPHNVKRPVDRAQLKMENHVTIAPVPTPPETDDGTYNNDEGTIDGVQLRLLRKWCTEKNTVKTSCIIYYLLSCPEYKCDEKDITRDGSITIHDLDKCKSKKCDNGKVIDRRKGMVQLNPNLLEFILEHTI